MIDLAIGTPEVGVVDFNMLQTVLHCLAQQMRILSKNVELRGSIAALPIGKVGENNQTIAISEFIVDTGAPGAYEQAPDGSTEQDTMLVVERIKNPKAAGGEASAAKPGPTAPPKGTIGQVGGQQVGGQQVGGQQAGGQQAGGQQAGGQQVGGQGPGGKPGGQVAGGKPGGQSPAPTMAPQAAPQKTGAPGTTQVPSSERLSLVTISKFNVLEGAVEDLKNRVYGSMPKNEDLLQEVRSQTNLKAITDMWTNLNVSSRLEAAEEGIGKLSSLVQDLIGETVDLQKAAGGQPSAAAARMTAEAKAVTAAAQSPRGGAGGGGAPGVAQGGMQTGPGGAQAGPGGMAQGGMQAGPGGVAQGGMQAGAGGMVQGGTQAGPGGMVQGGTQGGPGGMVQGGVQVGPGGVQGPGGQQGQARTPGAPGGTSTVEIQGVSAANLAGLATKEELRQVLAYLQQLRNDLNVLTETFYNSIKEVNPKFVPPPALPPPSSGPQTIMMIQAPTQSGMHHDAQAPGTPQKPGQPGALGPDNVLERLVDLEKKLKKCCDTIHKSEGLVNDQLTSFQDQLEHLSKQVFSTSGDLTGGKLSPDVIKDLQGLMQLFQTVQEMQAQLKQVHDTALMLASEKDDRQHHIDSLLEQIELLKIIKLDREDMVEALADKADLRMLARKVSHDQFEMACDDLSRGLENALGKLNVQESLWQQALDDIQREIETKLDKMELSPVKEFFNNKLRQLQENLKQMAALRREAEAAGTKRRLLRDVNCISCDAKAVMSMEAHAPLPPKPLPATLSMKPYLSYELDAIRKAQASGLQQRNMHDWEHIDKQMQPKAPHKVRSDTNKHLCNRYCGGSHTVTTPAQRVARLGHFIRQWGPEVLPLSSGFAAGDDGRLYKVSAAEGASVGPGGAVEGVATTAPKFQMKKAETPKGAKPLIISAECHCLESTERQ